MEFHPVLTQHFTPEQIEQMQPHLQAAFDKAMTAFMEEVSKTPELMWLQTPKGVNCKPPYLN